MSTAEALIKLPVTPGDPGDILNAAIHDANKIYAEGEHRNGETIRRLARVVATAERNAIKKGVSWRSLFSTVAVNDRQSAFSFSRRKGDSFLAVSRNETLMHPRFVQRTPADYNTLGKLAQIPADKLAALIEEGTVNAKTSRKAAADCVATVTGKQPEKKAGRTFSSDAYLAKIEDAYVSGRATRQQVVEFVNELILRCELKGTVK